MILLLPLGSRPLLETQTESAHHPPILDRRCRLYRIPSWARGPLQTVTREHAVHLAQERVHRMV